MDAVVVPPSQKRKLSEEWKTADDTDIISNLEDNILHYILSFLPTKDVIRTSILSRRWQYLWTSISDIDLHDLSSASEKGGDRSFFLDFIERVLLLHDASDIKRLAINISMPVTSTRLNSWVCTAMRHNLQALELYLPLKTHFVLPCFLFTCESLRVLELWMDCALKPPTYIHLPHLKTLHLHAVTFVDDDSTERFFSGCPVLEELELLNCGWKNIRNIKIRVPTLKELNIEQDLWESELSCVINLYAANLISLSCNTYLRVDFHLHDLSSLVNASIDSFSLGVTQNVSAHRVFNLVASAYNVESLTIVERSLDSLAETEDLLAQLPTFHNLRNLTVRTDFYGCERSSPALMDLLEKSPKLECLEFTEGFAEYSTFEERYFLERVPSCIENRLETCIISGFRGKPAEFHMLSYLLKNAKKLEKITLYRDVPSDEKLEEKLNNQIKMLRKGSENCLIELL